MNFIKDNGGILAVIAIVAVMVYGYMELRAPKLIADEVANKAYAQQKDVNDNSDDIADLEARHQADIDKVDEKLDKIIGILLEQ